MEKNIFQLDNEQLKEIARSFKAKVEEGLNTENAEIQCIPTFITPKASSINGKSLVLDLGGTNYRVAIVDFSKVPPTIHPNNGWKKDMSVMKSPGYTREELFKELADMITGIKREKEMPIGYCFSYPTESVPSGDAKLLRWTKGVDIKEMIGEVVGKPLLDYLNERNKIKFTNIKVLNDTVASLFAGLTDSSYDAYIGLIVGTGTNMATFIPADKIKKLSPSHKVDGLIPVNLESGNFHPPFLTAVDNTVDVISDNPGRQRFEKAVSGMYLGDILKATFPLEEFEEKFDAQKLTSIMNYPDIYKVAVAGGPVIDWKWYEVMYGERYMDTPQENPEGYAKTSLIAKAKDLKGKLLICQGAVDPVVVWEQSLSFIRECIKNNVQVDYFPYPCAEHNVMGRDRIHLMQKVTNYFEDYLK